MPAHLALPDGEGPHPGLLIIHEILGLTPQIHDVCARMAARGYATLAPDLFHRSSRKARCVVRALRELKRGHGAAFDDLEAARVQLAKESCVDGGRLGVMGFCMGGGFTVLLATRDPFRAAGVWYGDVPEDVEAMRGSCPMVASFGARDRPLRGHGERLRRHLEVVSVDHDVKVYEQAGHAFGLPDAAPLIVRALGRVMGMNAGHAPEAAEDAWRRVDEFFAKHLLAAS